MKCISHTKHFLYCTDQSVFAMKITWNTHCVDKMQSAGGTYVYHYVLKDLILGWAFWYRSTWP